MKLNKVMKSFFAATMATTVAIGMVGCGGAPAEKPADTTKEAPAEEKKDETATAEPVTIDIFQFKVEIADELQKAMDLYMEKNPNVKINLTTVGGGDDYGAAQRALFQSGQEPTIYNIGGPQDVVDWKEYLEDLSDQPWVSTAGTTLGAVTENGKIYGMPYAVEGYGLAYNKEIFETAGVDVSGIKDLESMDKAFAALDAKIKAGELKDKYPMLEAVTEMPAKELWVIGTHASNIYENQEFASAMDAFNAKEVNFTKGNDYKAYIDLMIKYSPNGATPAKANAVDYSTQVDQGIALERVAVVQQGNWIYNAVKGIDAAVADKLDFLPVGGDSIPLGVPMYWSINSHKTDVEKQAAKDFLNWLYTSDEGKDIIVNKFFFIPPFTGYEKYPAQDALGKAIMRFQAEGKTTPWVFSGYPTSWSEQVLGANLQKYIGGEISWDEALQAAKDGWKEARQ